MRPRLSFRSGIGSVAGWVALVLLVLMISYSYMTRPASFTYAEDRPEFVREDIRVLQEIAGISVWRFQYQLPADRSLYITAAAKLDDKPVPEMTKTWWITPGSRRRRTSGKVTVTCQAGGTGKPENEPSRWSFWYTNSGHYGSWWQPGNYGRGNGFNVFSPYDRSQAVSSGHGETYASVENLNDLQEHKLWEYLGHWIESDKSQHQHNFRYVLLVRAAKLLPEDPLREICEVKLKDGQFRRVNGFQIPDISQ